MAEKAAGKKKQQQQQPKQQQQQQPKQQVQQPKQQQQQQHKNQQQPKQQLQQQQKNKKSKQLNKNKNKENGIKDLNKGFSLYKNASPMNQKKKNKGNENNISTNNFNKFSKKKSGSNNRSFLSVFCIRFSYILLILGFIYIVDYEKFVRIRDGANFYVNKTVNLLPPEVLTKGKQAVEFIQPYAEGTFNKVNVFAKETSSFLNTNPLVKDHWNNIREISSICSARLVDYMRTLYLQITGYCNDVKTKLF